jgi:hypothetical protein
MAVILLPELVKQVFIDNAVTPEELSTIEINYGLRLQRLASSRFDRRCEYAKAGNPWLLNEPLGWGSSSFTEAQYPHRWDMLIDGSMLCFQHQFVEIIFYAVTQIDSSERISLQKQQAEQLADALLRAELLQRLNHVLIHKMYPYSKLFSGELENIYGVHLKEIKRGMHMNMPFKPGYGTRAWVKGRPLCWGSNTGWNITQDCKIACCRVDYDDYINFEIEILSPVEIAEYKKQFSKPDEQLVNRLATLQQMLDKQLISEAEYQQKKKELLDLV